MNTTEAVTRHYAVFSSRVRALVIDLSVVVGAIVAGMLLLELLPGDLAGRIYVILVVVTLFAYEPVLVATIGGTLGHRAQNLRVLDQNSDRRISLLRAWLRVLIKAVFGLFSFFFMAITRRHQALHDLATRSVIVVHDLQSADEAEYVVEISSDQFAVAVSKRRRVAVIAGYWLLILALLSVVPVPFVSEDCFLTDVCTRAEDRIFTIMGLFMMAGFGTTLVQGWRGRLPGARARRTE
ncbi:MAG: RDD family protein [Longimicrobiales bacterium]